MSRRRSLARWATLPVAAVIVALIVLLAASHKQTDSADSPLLGKVAPTLQGRTLAGAPFDLVAHRGQFVVVNFFASWCQPCQQEAPELRRWSEEHKATKDAVLVNVLFQDTPANATSFFARYGGADWPVLAADTDTIGLDWGVAKVPETFVVNPDGVVVVKSISTVTAANLDAYLARYRTTSTTSTTVTTSAATS